MFSRKVTGFAALIAALGLVASAHASPKRYLVQFKSAATFQAMSRNMAALSSPFNSVQAGQVHLFNTDTAVTQTLPNLKMMVIESEDGLAVESLRSHPAIAFVEPEFFHPAPQPIATHGPSGQMEIARNSKKPAAAMDIPWGITAVHAPQAWNTTRGQGARVMVLDTGIDQGHPALTNQIEAVQNFTGGDANDVTDDVGHGSHVSGTILADGKNGGLVGVAPEAKVLMGKVCSAQGCSSIAIAQGLDWAVTEHADVVNMSLGGPFMSQGEATAVQNAEDAGVLVIAASGNDGKPSVSFPGAAATVLAVGAIDINLAKADFSNWGPQLGIVGPGVDVISSVPRGTGRGSAIELDLDGKGLNEIKSLPFTGSPVSSAGTNTLVFADLGKPEDFAKVDVKGKFALVNRGEIAFKDKVVNAIAAGATGVLIVNNVPGLIPGTVTTDGSEVAVPVVMIEQSVGAAAQAALSAGQVVNGSIAVIKTDYASFQGTSMATPHVVGVAALVRAANKSLTPAQVRTLLKSTATQLSGPNDENQLGSGLVNAEAAVTQAVHMLPFQQVAN
jgi:subtilisin family serine protease